jgi:hypothetical protein
MLGVSRGIMNYYPELRMIFAQCAEWIGKRPPKQAMNSRESHAETSFLQLRWKSALPLPGFFYSYVGKANFSTVTLKSQPPIAMQQASVD